jgi:predicted PurR-regulated permease PerM
VHSLLVFFALLGGVKLFRIIGIFVGPVILSVTLVVLDMLRKTNLSWQPRPESPQRIFSEDKLNNIHDLRPTQ